jgi:hypothetical protein
VDVFVSRVLALKPLLKDATISRFLMLASARIWPDGSRPEGYKSAHRLGRGTSGSRLSRLMWLRVIEDDDIIDV